MFSPCAFLPCPLRLAAGAKLGCEEEDDVEKTGDLAEANDGARRLCLVFLLTNECACVVAASLASSAHPGRRSCLSLPLPLGKALKHRRRLGRMPAAEFVVLCAVSSRTSITRGRTTLLVVPCIRRTCPPSDILAGITKLAPIGATRRAMARATQLPIIVLSVRCDIAVCQRTCHHQPYSSRTCWPLTRGWHTPR